MRAIFRTIVFIFCRCDCDPCEAGNHCNKGACNTRVEQ